jgi:hypothetical protein
MGSYHNTDMSYRPREYFSASACPENLKSYIIKSEIVLNIKRWYDSPRIDFSKVHVDQYPEERLQWL